MKPLKRVLIVSLAAATCLLGLSVPAQAATSATIQSSDGAVNVRSGPGTTYGVTKSLTSGAAISVNCQAAGTNIAGTVRTTNQWDQLSTGGYVSDAYVSRSTTPPVCGAAAPPSGNTATVRTADGGALNARSGPGTTYSLVQTIPNWTKLSISCQAAGQTVTGTFRTTNMWDKLTSGAYVSDGYIDRNFTPPSCTAAPPAGNTATAQTSGGDKLNVRTGPGSSFSVYQQVASGSPLAISCQIAGQSVSGTVRSTNMWNKLTSGYYVSDAYTARNYTPPVCAAPPATGGDPSGQPALCRSERVVLCVNKSTRTTYQFIDGTVRIQMDARFGDSLGAFWVTPTGTHRVMYHLKDLGYMPWSLYFTSAGHAFHYSQNFRDIGYGPPYPAASLGCVNSRDYAKSQQLYDTTPDGALIYIYW